MTLASSYYPAFERRVLTPSDSGETETIPINFDFFDTQSNLVCKLYTESGEQTLSFSGYKSFPDGYSGVYAEVSVVVPTLTDNAELIVYRNVSNGQSTNFSHQSLSSDTTEEAFDKVHALIQDVNKWSYAITSPMGSISSPESLTLPHASDRAEKVLMFDENGDVETREFDEVLGESEYIKELDSRVADNTEAIENLDGRVSSFEDKLLSLDGRVTSNEASIEELDVRVKTNDGLIENAFYRINTNTESIEALGVQVEDNKRQIAVNTGVTVDLIGRVSVAEKDISFLGGGLEQVANRASQNSYDIEELESRVSVGHSVAKESINSLDRRVEEAERVIASNSDRITANEGAIASNSGRITALENGGGSGGGANIGSCYTQIFDPETVVYYTEPVWSDVLGLWTFVVNLGVDQFSGLNVKSSNPIRIFTPASMYHSMEPEPLSVEQLAQYGLVTQLEMFRNKHDENSVLVMMCCLSMPTIPLVYKIEEIS